MIKTEGEYGFMRRHRGKDCLNVGDRGLVNLDCNAEVALEGGA